MVVQTPPRQYSIEEYFAHEETAECRSEYRDGEIVLITGGSINHNQIIVNLVIALGLALREQDYRVYTSDLRLWIPRFREYTYPDILIIKDQAIFQEGRTDTVLNPSIIFEVLSKSTSSRDRGDKFTYYRSLPEFQEYILIDQYQIHIEQFSKTPEGNWLFKESDDEDGILTLVSANCQIPHRQIYERVTFENQPE
ncbi:Uma2 family endonuclease [Nostocaceae cyanobacterium CENA369]|uniref:Uma2 family endonuclease n=1 Tax=Dendronalium phyllosphericum CENA369 TaxID=1725256 RepID=A0A8J7LEB6_9NOST|nr:Uma2 family endonuclease [Dendronalium phyllosphericum]MBH8572614.1 Uma2 family endonuclease [Dendronalium phyllosphericum CENA369]